MIGPSRVARWVWVTSCVPLAAACIPGRAIGLERRWPGRVWPLWRGQVGPARAGGGERDRSVREGGDRRPALWWGWSGGPSFHRLLRRAEVTFPVCFLLGPDGIGGRCGLIGKRWGSGEGNGRFLTMSHKLSSRFPPNLRRCRLRSLFGRGRGGGRKGRQGRGVAVRSGHKAQTRALLRLGCRRKIGAIWRRVWRGIGYCGRGGSGAPLRPVGPAKAKGSGTGAARGKIGRRPFSLNCGPVVGWRNGRVPFLCHAVGRQGRIARYRLLVKFGRFGLYFFKHLPLHASQPVGGRLVGG